MKKLFFVLILLLGINEIFGQNLKLTQISGNISDKHGSVDNVKILFVLNGDIEYSNPDGEFFFNVNDFNYMANNTFPLVISKKGYKIIKKEYPVMLQSGNTGRILNIELEKTKHKEFFISIKEADKFPTGNLICKLNRNQIQIDEHGIGLVQLPIEFNSSAPLILTISSDKYKDYSKTVFYKDVKGVLFIQLTKKNSNSYLDNGLLAMNNGNYDKAILFFKKGEQVNCSKCSYHLGIIYLKGLGVNENFIIAKDYLEKSAALDNIDAIKTLSEILRNKDNERANYWADKLKQLKGK